MSNKQYKVLDLSTLFPGPLSSYLLSELNFDVTKVEDIRNPDVLRLMWPTFKGVSVAYQEINRHKKIIEIDYRSESDKEKLKNLIKSADVLIENFRPGRMEKLDLGYNQLLKLNSNIIYCSITGFGYEHRLSKKGAHDINILGYSGYFALNNNFNIPPLQFADIITAYEATIQILASLLNGKSRWLDISMLKSLTKASVLTNSIEDHLKREIKPEEYILWGTFPCYNIYKTKDGKYMVLGAIEYSFWNNFCNATNLTELVDKQFDADLKIKERVQSVTAKKTQSEWVEENLDCFTPVLTFTESKKNDYI